jgi:glycosyltransferase involved in cell wall biosynthesis
MSIEVSIVVPAYHAQAFILRAARSVFAQTLPDWELIVVADDGADYATVLREGGIEDPRVRFETTGRVGGGAGAARNVGIDVSRGEVVVLLDADDGLHPVALTRLVPIARTHGVAYCDVAFVRDPTGGPLPNLDRPLPAGLVSVEDVLISRVHTYAPIAFDRHRVRARSLEGRIGWEDVCFFVRCVDDAGGVYHLDEPLYVYRRRDGSTSTESERGAAEYYRASAESLLADVAAGGTLGIRDPSLRDLFVRYLRGRERLEAVFLREYGAGQWTDFLAFAAARPELFNRLEPSEESSP